MPGVQQGQIYYAWSGQFEDGLNYMVGLEKVDVVLNTVSNYSADLKPIFVLL